MLARNVGVPAAVVQAANVNLRRTERRSLLIVVACGVMAVGGAAASAALLPKQAVHLFSLPATIGVIFAVAGVRARRGRQGLELATWQRLRYEGWYLHGDGCIYALFDAAADKEHSTPTRFMRPTVPRRQTSSGTAC